MRALCSVFVAVLVSAVVSSPGQTWACDTDTPPVGFAYDWPRSTYRLVFLHPEGNDPTTEATRQTLSAFFTRVGKTTNLKLVDLAAPVASPEVVLFSPTDEVLFRKSGSVSAQELDALVSSPVRAALVRKLERTGLVVVLLVEGTDAKAAATARKTIESSIATFGDLFEVKLEMVTVRSDDPAEELLLAGLGVKPAQAGPHAFVLFGWAKAVERDLGEITEEKLMDRFHRLLIDTTLTWPHHYDSDLLVNWSK